MDWQQFFNANISRKAQVVVATLVAIAYVAGLEGVECQVKLCAIIASLIIGLAGVAAQGIIDYKHPNLKDETDAPPVRDEHTS